MSKKDDPKTQALRRHGTLHPHPELVKDELFCQDAFFDPRDAVQVKYEMLRRVRVDGWPASHAAREAGFSRPTFYEAHAAFQNGGLPGLLPAKKGPRRAHKLTDVVTAFIDQEIEKQPEVGMGEIADRVFERFGLRVHARSIRRALAQREKKTP
ncbi:MAG: helix-turn-helix domain-containing protein [Deltaproteobacteria bacterium]|nr:helix-turn-helix domain-containing protein [Deltaproteobacteria bacterium]